MLPEIACLPQPLPAGMRGRGSPDRDRPRSAARRRPAWLLVQTLAHAEQIPVLRGGDTEPRTSNRRAAVEKGRRLLGRGAAHERGRMKWTYEQAIQRSPKMRRASRRTFTQGSAGSRASRHRTTRTARLIFDGSPTPFGSDLLTAPILPRHVYEGKEPLAELDLIDRPVGSGPFLLKSWTEWDSRLS